MAQDKDTEKLFIGRYVDLWICFNPGRIIQPGLRDVGKKYYQLLADEGVEYKDFDRICSIVEKGFNSLGYDFNLVAYVLEFINAERLESAQAKAIFYSKPIELPSEGKKLLSDNPKMAEAIKILEKNRINGFIEIVERLNAKRKEGKDREYQYQCEACRDTGWVNLRNNTVATCTCHQGKRIRTKDGNIVEIGIDDKGKKIMLKEATIEDCKAAVSRDDDILSYERQFDDNPPF